MTLIPPRASDAHLAALGSVTSGLIHAPATPGLTGARRPLSPYLPHLVRRARTLTGLPVAVGIGIGTPDQAAQASAYADSVIVGSAVIRRMHTHPGAAAVTAAEAARDFALNEKAEATRRAYRGDFAAFTTAYAQNPGAFANTPSYNTIAGATSVAALFGSMS